MRIVLLANARAGRGRGGVALAAIDDALRASGHHVARVVVSPQVDAELGAALVGAELMLIAGGDGTVHHALPRAIESGVPVAHVPFGTENLFAREFAMTRDAAAVVRLVQVGRSRLVDVGMVSVGGVGGVVGSAGAGSGGVPFALMVSIGPDASVVERLHKARTGGISHLSYAGPMVREMVSPYLPRMVVKVDGREVVRGKKGLLLIANSRQYALRANPARRADMQDGLLDVVFMPARSAIGALWWLIRARMGWRFDVTGAGTAGLVYERAKVVSVVAEGDRGVYQVDGEHAVWPRPLEMRCEVSPRRLGVWAMGEPGSGA